MMIRTLPILLALAIVAPSVADASNKRTRERAKRFAKKASKDFRAKRYERALRGFTKAYELTELPALQYNIGQCHLLLGAHEAAIEAFERFLQGAPDTPYAADVRKLIGEARAEVERKRPPPPVVALPAPPPPAPPPPVAPPVVVSAPPAPEDDSSVLSEWWLWAVVAGVAVAGGTAIAFAAQGDTTTVLPMGDLGVIDRRTP